MNAKTIGLLLMIGVGGYILYQRQHKKGNEVNAEAQGLADKIYQLYQQAAAGGQLSWYQPKIDQLKAQLGAWGYAYAENGKAVSLK